MKVVIFTNKKRKENEIYRNKTTKKKNLTMYSLEKISISQKICCIYNYLYSKTFILLYTII